MKFKQIVMIVLVILALILTAKAALGAIEVTSSQPEAVESITTTHQITTSLSNNASFELIKLDNKEQGEFSLTPEGLFIYTPNAGTRNAQFVILIKDRSAVEPNLTYNLLFTVNPALRIEDLKVNDVAKNSFDSVNDVVPGTTLTFDFTVHNYLNDYIENLQVTAYTETSASYKALPGFSGELELEQPYLSADDEQVLTKTYTIPQTLAEGKYIAQFKVSGSDVDGNDYEEIQTIWVNVVRAPHQLTVGTVQVGSLTCSPQKKLSLTIPVANIGSTSEFVTLKIDGEIEASQAVTINSRETKNVVFQITPGQVLGDNDLTLSVFRTSLPGVDFYGLNEELALNPITVSIGNCAPVFVTPNSQFADGNSLINMIEDVPKTLDFGSLVTDVDSADLTFTVLDTTHLTFAQDANKVLTITPSADWSGRETFIINVNDGTNPAVSKQVTVVVARNPSDDLPTIEEITAVEEFIKDTETATLAVMVQNPDAQVLTYNWYVDNVAVAGQSLNSFTFRGNSYAGGNHNIRVAVTYPGQTVALGETWEIRVIDRPTDGAAFGAATQISQATNPASVSGLVLENTNGKIVFTQNVDLSDIEQLAPVVTIQNNLVSVDSVNAQGLNRPATISVYNTNFQRPVIMKRNSFDDGVGILSDNLLELETKSYTIRMMEYDITPSYVGSDGVRFTVNGEITSKLNEGETYVLVSGLRIGVSEILYQPFAGGIRSVTFFLEAPGTDHSANQFVSCPATECQLVSNVGGVVTFTVTHFSSYQIVEQPTYGLEVTPAEAYVSQIERDQDGTINLTLKNIGANTLSGLTYEFVSVNAKYNARLTGLPATSALNQVDTLQLTVNMPADEAAGKHSIGSLKIKSNGIEKSVPVYISPKSFLTVTKTEVNSAKGKLELDAVNKIKVTVKNDYTQEIEGIKVTVKILDVDDETLEEESEEFSLNSGSERSTTLSFDLKSLDLDKSSYNVETTVEGTGTNDNSKHVTTETKNVDVDRARHDIVIAKAELSAETLSCSRQTSLTVDIRNQGKDNEDKVAIKVTNSALKILKEKTAIELDDFSGGDNEYSTKFNLDLTGVAPGAYTLTVDVLRDGTSEDTEDLTFTVGACSQAQASTQTGTATTSTLSGQSLATQIQQGLQQRTTTAQPVTPAPPAVSTSSFRNSDVYTPVLGIMGVLLFLAIVMGLVVLLKRQ